MPTVHESLALRLFAALEARFTAEGDPVPTRSGTLPVDCPLEGLINLRMADAVEEGRRFGAGSREWSRVAMVEIVVQAPDDIERAVFFDALAARVGGLYGQPIEGVDHLELSAVVDAEEPPVSGDAPVQAGVVEITIYYETGENPLEEI